MSYRNITVDGIKYQYVVGKSYVKIKGLGVWPKADVGVEIDRDMDSYAPNVEVYPSHIADLIKEYIG